MQDDGGVVHVVLDHPPANALSNAVIARLVEVVDELDADPGVNAVVVRAAGDRFFCAGGDITELGGLEQAGAERRLLDFHHLLCALERLAKPLVCAVNGHAVGGGFELCLFADVVLAVPGVKMGFPEIRQGLMPGSKGMKRAVEELGLPTARRFLVSGELIDVEAARAMGIVDAVVDPSGLRREAVERARSLASDRLYIGRIKRSLAGIAARDDDDLARLDVENLAAYFRSEAMRSRVERFVRGAADGAVRG